MQTHIVRSILEVSAADWNRLSGTTQPFLRHEFLAALENSGAVGPDSGWQPSYLLAQDPASNQGGALAGAMPLYRKLDSWGEFVFDWAWADAYRRAGLRYFPKLVAAVPFTPATGSRLLVAPGASREQVTTALITSALDQARCGEYSSLHILFPDAGEAAELGRRGLMLRKDCQFHWHNRGYASFEDFLGELTAEKRKKLRRERRRVAEAGIGFRVLGGSDIDDALWARILPLYGDTFRQRGREPYLGAAFFQEVARALPENLVVILAEAEGHAVAVAICFRSEDTLYGRYWGSRGGFHSLHFETCYYQGIDYCIAQGLKTFEPGAQGEHKIARGFTPSEVWSAHWLSDARFAAAIDRYVDEERRQVERYMDVVNEHLPYRREPS